MRRKITVYEAARRGKREQEDCDRAETVLRNRISELETQLTAAKKKLEYPYSLEIKAWKGKCSEEYLNKFLTAVQPIKDVVRATWVAL